jgi:predicted GIY-YIG superfamily endonuclease
MPFFVYILADRRGGTLYTGCTDDIFRLVTEHKVSCRRFGRH